MYANCPDVGAVYVVGKLVLDCNVNEFWNVLVVPEKVFEAFNLGIFDDKAPSFIIFVASNVLLLNVSVVKRPISVSVVVGNVKVPVFNIVEIVGFVKVLFVKVSVVARPISVSVDDGNVKVPVLTIVEIVGFVKVLFKRVSVVFVPTKVVEKFIGRVNVPVPFTILAILGKVKVLLVKVSVVVRPISVSVVFIGRVNVPVPFTIVDILGAVKVLLVNISVVFLHTNVSVATGNVNVFPVVFIILPAFENSKLPFDIVIPKLSSIAILLYTFNPVPRENK
jgi:hypothetical protein